MRTPGHTIWLPFQDGPWLHAALSDDSRLAHMRSRSEMKFQGPHKQERRTRVCFKDGTVIYFQGKKGEEAKRSIHYADKRVQMLVGAKGEECVVRERSASGETTHFRCDKRAAIMAVTRSAKKGKASI